MTNLSVKNPENKGITTSSQRRFSCSEASTQLPNGLRVVSATLSHLHSAALTLFAPGGPRYERLEDNGLSHLVEHGLFRGCSTFPAARDFNEALESCSLGLGAATYREFVALDALCAPERIEELLALLGAMLDAPTWQDLDIEQRIIVEELQDELDEKGRDIDVDNLAKLTLMPKCGGGRKIGGDISRVKRFNTEDCQRWFEACYGAKNLVLSVASPLPHDEVVRIATEALGGLREGEHIEALPITLRGDLPALEYVEHGGSQSSLQIAWVVPPPQSPEWPIFNAIQRLLDDGTCSRLRRRITDDEGLAYHVGSNLEAFTEAALLVIEADVSHDKVLPVLDAVFEEIALLASGSVEEKEWSRIRERYNFDLALAIDGASEVSYRVGLAAFHDRPLELDSAHRKFMEIDREEIARVAERYLHPSGAQITLVGELDPLCRAGLRRRIHRLRGTNQSLPSHSR